MSKFKVGDRVRALTTGGYGKVAVGDIGTVTEIGPWGYDVKFPNYPDPLLRYLEEIELVEADSESELARLVRVANEGLEAMRTLCQNHPAPIPGSERIELDNKWAMQSPSVQVEGWVGYFGGRVLYDTDTKLCIKPKRPEPITLSTGWKVEIDGERVRVGCQSFDAKEAMFCLQQFIRTEAPAHSFGGIQVLATRKGIFANGSSHLLPWADADKLLAYLEEHLANI